MTQRNDRNGEMIQHTKTLSYPAADCKERCVFVRKRRTADYESVGVCLSISYSLRGTRAARRDRVVGVFDHHHNIETLIFRVKKFHGTRALGIPQHPFVAYPPRSGDQNRPGSLREICQPHETRRENIIRSSSAARTYKYLILRRKNDGFRTRRPAVPINCPRTKCR